MIGLYIAIILTRLLLM